MLNISLLHYLSWYQSHSSHSQPGALQPQPTLAIPSPQILLLLFPVNLYPLATMFCQVGQKQFSSLGIQWFANHEGTEIGRLHSWNEVLSQAIYL